MADIKSHSTLTTNLISYWDMEEASGTRYDLHGSNNLTSANSVAQGTGKIGNCADLERGSDQYLWASDSASLPHSGSGDDISAFAWVKFESVVSWETIIQHYLQSGNQRSWSFYHDGSNLNFELSNNGSGTTTSAVVAWTPSTATWYYIGFTYDVSAGEVKFYVNGSQQGTTQTGKDTSYYASSARLLIGSFYDGSASSGSFDGLIEEVGLWKKVLTTGEISDLYNSGNGLPYYDPTDIKNNTLLSTSLVSYWKLESDGTDSHGSNTLTASGSPSYVAGKLNNAVDLESGSSQRLSKTTPVSVQTGSGSRSVSMWVNIESATPTDTYRVLFSYGNDSANEEFTYTLVNLSGTHYLGLDKNGALLSSTWTPSTATWYHLLVTYNGTNIQYFVNGVHQGSAVAGGTINTVNSDPLHIGARTGATPLYFFDGIIDETALYSKALTVAEVRALYGYGTPPEYEVATTGIKTINGLAKASVKTVNGLAIASVKTKNGLA